MAGLHDADVEEKTTGLHAALCGPGNHSISVTSEAAGNAESGSLQTL